MEFSTHLHLDTRKEKSFNLSISSDSQGLGERSFGVLNSSPSRYQEREILQLVDLFRQSAGCVQSHGALGRQVERAREGSTGMHSFFLSLHLPLILRRILYKEKPFHFWKFHEGKKVHEDSPKMTKLALQNSLINPDIKIMPHMNDIILDAIP